MLLAIASVVALTSGSVLAAEQTKTRAFAPKSVQQEPLAEYAPSKVISGQRYQRVDKILTDLVPKIQHLG